MPKTLKPKPSKGRVAAPKISSYARLAMTWAPRPIHTKRDHDDAFKAIEALAMKETIPGSLDEGEAQYLDAVTAFLEAYDDAHSPRTPPPPAHVRLRTLVEEAGMTVAALGKVVGSPSYASLLLSGKRKASRNVALALGKHFRMDPGYFL